MYSNRFAICIMVDGKVQKELADGTVSVPLGTEYKVKLFNKHDRRAVAKLYIDTENVSEGGFVVPAHGHIEVARRADRDTAFRFVALGSQAARESGKPDQDPNKEMGLIEAHFFLEKEQPKIEPCPGPHYPPPCPGPHYPPYRPWGSTPWNGGILRSCGGLSSSIGGSIGGNDADNVKYAFNATRSRRGGQSRGLAGSLYSANAASVPDCEEVADEPIGSSTPLKSGCTVDGNATGVNYATVYVDLEATSTVLKLFLQGYKQPVQVRKPVVQVRRRRK